MPGRRTTREHHEVIFRGLNESDETFEVLLDWTRDGKQVSAVAATVPTEEFVELGLPFDRRGRFWQALANLAARRVRQAVEYGRLPSGPAEGPFVVQPNVAWAAAMARDDGALPVRSPGDTVLAFDADL